jgi:hypothetical protein
MFALIPLGILLGFALLAKRGGANAEPAQLDAGMPPQIAKATKNALRDEHDPTRLQQCGDAIAPYYPHAAALLHDRAHALKG